MAKWQEVSERMLQFVKEFPDDTILIGGIAVYLHSLASERAGVPAEYTQDVDVYVGLPAWGTIRENYETTPNNRLAKSQMKLGSVEFDIYVQKAAELCVTYEQVALYAERIDGIRVACKEHLLLLKLKAFANRKASSHGRKDRRDLAKLLVLLADSKPDQILAYVTDKDVSLLLEVICPDVFLELTNQNAHLASKLRKRAVKYVDKLVVAMA
jgi:hypothetical protein